ncbi:DAK2 domain-containing protein [Eggerthellaceae bacterium zg-1084]|uniref:DAK2 domain-containing protein n=1 Tax=Berryella wangjianweii TaxID=2734634 RepID=A0A6M8J5Q6_9ACTN|nr:DAK2 domain-containing protein [Berryella wangjianweii]NPD31239.1 DAK2 domain-containing protein [Berryella wangjianweii]QKF06789.1 DAK2 domain-containing protein [Berryella wangjianweii]
MSEYSPTDLLNALAAASRGLSERKEEVNRLNVFPVPDGDTGTNMSLTLESVVANVAQQPEGASKAALCKAITTGALMGARGNSGVITSQIFRGLCEGVEAADTFDVAALDASFARAQEVAFQAVRKPVEGTILTVLRDIAQAARHVHKKRFELDDALDHLVSEAYASVQRTPDFLPVLRENNVVDAGGYGLALILDGFVAALKGREGALADELSVARIGAAPKVAIELNDDWEGSEYRYCTEFLVSSDELDVDAARDFLPTMGDCDLLVGTHPNFKVHVHTNRPDQVLEWFLTHEAQVAEVHIHNMQLQSAERTQRLASESASEPAPYGFVAVASGEGNAKILASLGIDEVVSGGQTMNPSTKDLLEAIGRVNARRVIVLPNNSNIIMAAQSACELAESDCAVVPTKTLPQAFSAMFGFSEDAALDENVAAMTEAFAEVRTGEVTHAVKDSRDAHGNPIAAGDVIGIADGSIEAVGSRIDEVCMRLLEAMGAEDADTITVLAGADLSADDEAALLTLVEERFDDAEVESHRGEQPLYPVIIAVE